MYMNEPSLMDLPPNDPLTKRIQTIKKSGQRAAAIVQDMLTLTRRGVPVSEPVDLNRIISDYADGPEHEKLISHHPGVRLETDLSEAQLNILGSPLHLTKTVMNLIANAAEAMSQGGMIRVSIGLQKIDRPINGYETVPEGKYVVLTVSDTGVGISTEDMQRIFEPFYTKKVMGRSGTGLGMEDSIY